MLPDFPIFLLIAFGAPLGALALLLLAVGSTTARFGLTARFVLKWSLFGGAALVALLFAAALVTSPDAVFFGPVLAVFPAAFAILALVLGLWKARAIRSARREV